MSTAVESEVCIQFDRSSGTAWIYTTDREKAELLIKNGLTPTETDCYKIENGQWAFEVPKQAIRVKVGNRAIKIGGGKPIMPGTQPLALRNDAGTSEQE